MSHPSNDQYLEYENERFEEAEVVRDISGMDEVIARLRQNGFATEELEKRLEAVEGSE